MGTRFWLILLLVVVPGASLAGISTYFLFPEWEKLTDSYQNYQKVSGGGDWRDLAIAEAAENRHRINCFAEGVGVLLGGTIFAIGIHGLCLLPSRP
jgi:uncharacterized membrane protein YedE/YeeE